MKIIHACLSDSPLIYELLHHLHQCRKSAQNFFGRELELRKLRTYVTSDSHKIPFFVFGRGGSGKTALLSKACHLIHSEWYKRGLSTFAFPKPLYLFRCEASAGCPILRVHSDVQLCAGPGHVPVSANLLQSQHQVGQRTKNKEQREGHVHFYCKPIELKIEPFPCRPQNKYLYCSSCAAERRVINV